MGDSRGSGFLYKRYRELVGGGEGGDVGKGRLKRSPSGGLRCVDFRISTTPGIQYVVKRVCES